jgi:3-oxoacyl-[acyl-carrier-protein] synthase-1
MSTNTENKILITGMGVISALGNNVEENLTGLCSEKTGIGPIELLKGMRRPLVGGEVKLDQKELVSACEIDFTGKIHRSTLLGLKAAKEAWDKRHTYPKIRTALFYGTTIGGINMNDLDLLEGDEEAVNYSDLHDPTYAADFIMRNLGIKGYRATLSTACSTAANAILLGARMIRAGMIDRALVGGSEALTNYTLNGFDALQLYDEQANRPFDKDRAGLNLGEGGAFLVLESELCQKQTKSNILAELIGWGNACDGYHQTASSPDGTGSVLSFQEAIRIAGISTQEIDYVNVHGTGTPNNDLTESTVLRDLFDPVPPFSSTKSYTGHTLAAAGGIEAVYSILSLQTGMLFPNLQFKTPIEATQLSPITSIQKNAEPKIILSSSFGFGGNCTQLIFRKWSI